MESVADQVVCVVRSVARLRVRRSITAAFVVSIGVGTVSGTLFQRLPVPDWAAGLVAAGMAAIFAVSVTLDAVAFLLRDLDRLIDAATKMADPACKDGQAPAP